MRWAYWRETSGLRRANAEIVGIGWLTTENRRHSRWAKLVTGDGHMFIFRHLNGFCQRILALNGRGTGPVRVNGPLIKADN